MVVPAEEWQGMVKRETIGDRETSTIHEMKESKEGGCEMLVGSRRRTVKEANESVREERQTDPKAVGRLRVYQMQSRQEAMTRKRTRRKRMVHFEKRWRSHCLTDKCRESDTQTDMQREGIQTDRE